MYMSSPVFGDGLIYGHSSKKKDSFLRSMRRLAPCAGPLRAREGEHASLLLTPQHVVFLTNGADLIVAKRGTPAFTVERRYEVAKAATWAMPVLLGSNILVRDATGLMLLTVGTRPQIHTDYLKRSTRIWKIDSTLYCNRLIDASVDGMFAFDRECSFIAWNRAMQRISGFSRR